MELLANDLSFHGQFHDLQSFRAAFDRLMVLRKIAGRFGREVHCHRAMLQVAPLPAMSMQHALGRLNRDEQRAALLWLRKSGPFWDDLRRHGPDDWLESRGAIVTDHAVGEVAYRTLHGIESGLIGASPSDWDYSPVKVRWRREAEGRTDRTVAVPNWWLAATLERWMENAPAPTRTWHDVHLRALARFERLIFAADSFEPLSGLPFNQSASARILFLLDTLDKVARETGADGTRTREGQHLYQQYFTGQNALFSDSSDSEKRGFRDQLTFRDPGDPSRTLFCPWHGKERHMTLRVHFSWPMRERICVVYAGPKLTKR